MKDYQVGDLIYIKMLNGQIWEIIGVKTREFYDAKIDEATQLKNYTVQSIYSDEIKTVQEDDVMLVCKAKNAEEQKKSFIRRKKLFKPTVVKERKEEEEMTDKTMTVSKEVNDMLDKISYDRNLDALLDELAKLVHKRDNTKNNKTTIKNIEVVKRKLEKLTKDISNNKEVERMES